MLLKVSTRFVCPICHQIGSTHQSNMVFYFAGDGAGSVTQRQNQKPAAEGKFSLLLLSEVDTYCRR